MDLVRDGRQLMENDYSARSRDYVERYLRPIAAGMAEKADRVWADWQRCDAPEHPNYREQRTGDDPA